MNDIDLLNLAETSCRFERIAKLPLRDRYANKYFVFYDDTDDRRREMYEKLFSRFGRSADINAIEVNKIRNIDDEDHWLPSLLRQYAVRLREIKLIDCSFRSTFDILSQRNLRKLELNRVRIPTNTIKQTIQNNPQLESLIARDCIGIEPDEDTMEFIAKNLQQLKELILIDTFDSYEWEISDEIMDSIVNLLKKLESLGLTINSSHNVLLHRLGLECVNLRHLELNYHDDSFSNEIVEALRLFETVENLSLTNHSAVHYEEWIESIVEYLPNLCHFKFYMEMPRSHTFILSSLRKCSTLKTITIDCFEEPIFFMDSQFFNEFTKTMKWPHGKVEIMKEGQILGFITKNEVVWRNKLLNWIGYDPNVSPSKVNLLDLANSSDAPVTETKAQQKCSPFDSILDYLDLSSFHSLSLTCKRSKQLLEAYVKQHSQRNGLFTISNELRCDTNELSVFAKQVKYLKLCIFREDNFSQILTAINHYRNLNKLWICGQAFADLRLRKDLVFPQVRHLIFVNRYSIDFDLHEISRSYPELVTFEIDEQRVYKSKRNPNLENHGANQSLKFNNLEKFIFKYSNETDIGFVRENFENTTTELIPINTCEIDYEKY